MGPSRYPVLWFFALTFALSFLGQVVHLYVMQRLSAESAGMPISQSPVRAWMPYAFYLTNVGPSLVGLALTGSLYRLAGVRRLVRQLMPWSVGRAWPMLAVCLLLPLAITVALFTILAALGKSDAVRKQQLRASGHAHLVYLPAGACAGCDMKQAGR